MRHKSDFMQQNFHFSIYGLIVMGHLKTVRFSFRIVGINKKRKAFSEYSCYYKAISNDIISTMHKVSIR